MTTRMLEGERCGEGWTSMGVILDLGNLSIEGLAIRFGHHRPTLRVTSRGYAHNVSYGIRQGVPKQRRWYPNQLKPKVETV